MEERNLMNSKYRIYIDLDGVLADFDSGVEGYRESDDVMWAFVRSAGPSFWEKLPFLDQGRELWEYIKTLNPIILSAHPGRRESDESVIRDAIEGKLAWIDKHLGSEFVVSAKIGERSEKKLYANSNSILIDDYIKNIMEFRSAGGIAIHYKDQRTAMQELMAIMAS